MVVSLSDLTDHFLLLRPHHMPSSIANPRLNPQSLLRIGVGSLLLIIGLVWFIQWWRYPPAVETENLKYIQLLRTAVSSESPDMLAKVKEAIQHRFDEGEMSKTERDHFDRIIRLAEARDWKTAHETCFRFEESQLSRRRANSTSGPK